jgi:hypothetical protein
MEQGRRTAAAATASRRQLQQARDLAFEGADGVGDFAVEAVRVRALWRACPRPERTAVDRDGRRADSRFMPKRVERNAMLGRYGVRYSRVYWAATAAMFALLIVDIFDDGAIWNYGVIVLIIIAIALRPGGVRGPRAAAAANEPGPSAAGAADEPAPAARS